ncbi:MAG TPA: MBOAT family O-acyltransferase [Magnetospirillum sp.]|jgi:D-alanyl-lipoteichoic acid acyltransferase DltB (MBOAT superfamily)|nr:MBOAT family O-acyltransferase [Magnetospirillum sp.]
MLFSSYEFIFCFLPLVIATTLMVQRAGDHAAKLWLAGASLVFYAWWSTTFVWMLIASIAANYGLLQLSLRRPAGTAWRHRVMVAGIVLNLSLLAWFKYAGFLAFNLSALTGANFDLGQIVLPLGISFFTFQKVALLVDVNRGHVEDITFPDFLLFVTFFPQLIAGPIVLYPEVAWQFRQPARVRVSAKGVQIGLTLFAIGLAKKVFLADELERYATPLFNLAAGGRTLSGADAWIGALSYSFQLYFDFSGYSDMAIGLAAMFGIGLPVNFLSPYKSRSIIEFWRRWHVTLSHFLRVYLYFPLGGSRCGPVRRQVNLMVVMLLGGLWHGAAWTFVAWGALHGAYLVVNHLWRAFAERLAWRPSGALVPALASLSWAVSFVAVVAAWVLFRADSFAAASTVLTAMFAPDRLAHLAAWSPDTSLIPRVANAGPWLAAAFAVALLLPNSRELLGPAFPCVEAQPAVLPKHRYLAWRPTPLWAAWGAMCLVLGVLGLSRPQVFIYFQF